MTPQAGDSWEVQDHGGAAAGRGETLLGEPSLRADRDGGVGAALTRADGPAKAAGRFPYSSDLRVPGMLHGATVRSPHAAARIRRIDTTVAGAAPGVQAVLTADDVPGDRLVGSILPDQPVLAFDEVRHHGEPVALVAADTDDQARAAAMLVEVDYAPLTPVTTVEQALAPRARSLHSAGNLLRELRIRRGEAPDPAGEDLVTVTGSYEVGSQDQAFLGPESGLAIPDGDGGVELHIASQWLHVDRDQVAAGLGLPPERVRLVLAGVGGAFGAREDLSMQLHACLLALRTQRPVRMAYSREESFLGHPHRHPARMTYTHTAERATGRLRGITATVELDGGAYASSSTAVVANASSLAVGPYACPHADITGTVAYTNNPPNGAMRGFGAVQVAIAYEAQMDRLAQVLGFDPVELRLINALQEGDPIATGQAVRGPAATTQLLQRLRDEPLPEAYTRDPRDRPGAMFASSPRGEGVVRGVGYAAGVKNVAFSEGFDDPATARVRAELGAGATPVVTVHTAAAEVGQSTWNVHEQIAREELGIADVRLLAADTAIASAGSASASRLSWMAGGAVQAAARAVREELALRPGATLTDKLATGPVEAERTYHHLPTEKLDADGQGDSHAGFAFVAHRAVVDVDVELGLARVVELVCAQDVGRVINPLALTGQLEGGSIQGLGLALTEELLVDERGRVQTAGFGEYRLPTLLDAPQVRTIVLELADPATPYGLRGAGELPSITSTPAILAALRAATGRPVTRAPARPEDLIA